MFLLVLEMPTWMKINIVKFFQHFTNKYVTELYSTQTFYNLVEQGKDTRGAEISVA
jgi:hypothetical protein